MDIETIAAELNGRFGEKLPEYYKRRIIVWEDPDREFEETACDLKLDNAKVAKLTGNNNFAVKKLLCADDTESNFLLYDPCAYEKLEKDWLLDIKLYSGQTYRVDAVSRIINELGLDNTKAIRDVCKAHGKLLKNKTNRKRIATALSAAGNAVNADTLEIMFIAAVLNVSPDAMCIMADVLSKGIDADSNAELAKIQNNGLSDAFARVSACFGYETKDATVDLGELLSTIAVTASFGGRDDLPGRLMAYIKPAASYSCQTAIACWQKSDMSSYMEIMSGIEEDLGIRAYYAGTLFQDNGEPCGDATETIKRMSKDTVWPCADTIIISFLSAAAGQHNIDNGLIAEVSAQRHIATLSTQYARYYDALCQIGSMNAYLTENEPLFHKTDTRAVWNDYCANHYKMDMYYRRCVQDIEAAKLLYLPELEESLQALSAVAEGLYTTQFLTKLADMWEKTGIEELRTQGKLSELTEPTESGTRADVCNQWDFYKRFVAKSAAKSRTYVIISDGMRYEVAAQLAEELRLEGRAQVTLHSMQGILPSRTSFGMAALLPHERLSLQQGLKEKVYVLADGKKTEKSDREARLKERNPQSIVLNLSELAGFSPDERKKKIYDLRPDIVYIYQDVIDDVGHTANTSAFEVCEKAILLIKKVISTITGDSGSGKFYITADHGFVCTKMGTEYDHGGASLEEMVVPLIEYHYLRSDRVEYKKHRSKYDISPVVIRPSQAVQVVSSLTVAMNFYQTEAVSSIRRSERYTVYFADAAGPVSDRVAIMADKEDIDATARQWHVTFKLQSREYDAGKAYYLIIADNDGDIVSKQPVKIDIPCAGDFGW